MAWIESHQTLIGHPKTRKAARLLNIQRVHIVGHLHALWWWVLDYADDGDISQFDADVIADACEWEGDPDEFLSALIVAGFLDKHADCDALFVHDWDDYAGRLVRRRQANAQRMRETRATNVQRTSETRADTCEATVPYHTEPNQTEPTALTRARARVRGGDDIVVDTNDIESDAGDDLDAFTNTELRIADELLTVRGMRQYTYAEIIAELREANAARGTYVSEQSLLLDAKRFAKHYAEKRNTTAHDRKWRGAKRAVFNWFTRSKEQTLTSNDPSVETAEDRKRRHYEKYGHLFERERVS
jgi:hypothetical protein